VRGGPVEEVDLPIVRKSLRCFWLGAIGLIPGIGFAVAWQSLSSFKQICNASGEQPRVAFPIALLATAFVVNPLLHVGLPNFGDIVATLLIVAIFGIWSWTQYLRTKPRRWNPARSWAWAGATFGAIGFALSVLALQFVYVSAYGRFFRGLL
jgi:hypothetical protein